MAKRRKLAPPIAKVDGYYKVDLPRGEHTLYNCQADALRAKIVSDAEFEVEAEVDSVMRRCVLQMKHAALKQRFRPTVVAMGIASISAAGLELLLGRVWSYELHRPSLRLEISLDPDLVEIKSGEPAAISQLLGGNDWERQVLPNGEDKQVFVTNR